MICWIEITTIMSINSAKPSQRTRRVEVDSYEPDIARACFEETVRKEARDLRTYTMPMWLDKIVIIQLITQVGDDSAIGVVGRAILDRLFNCPEEPHIGYDWDAQAKGQAYEIEVAKKQFS